MCGLKVRFSQSPERRGVLNYALHVEVLSASGMPKKIFVYHQSPAGIDGNTFAEFDHVATPVDFQEIPEDAASNTVPWYRTDKVVVWFRNVSDLNLAKQMFVDDISALQKTYDVLTSKENFARQSDIEFTETGVHEEPVPEEEGSIEQDIAAMKTEISGKLSKDALDGVEFETNDAAGIREAVKIMGNALGAKIAKSIAFIFGLCSLCAQGAGFSGAPYAQLDLDENPLVVTNVTFDGLATDVAISGVTQDIAQVQEDIASNMVNIASNSAAIAELTDTTATLSGSISTLSTNVYTKAEAATKADLDPMLFAYYYPEGNVKSVAEFTAGIKYDAPDEVNRTITVKPFCNTGTAENDNSSLVGRVVIPPFVDAQGNGYISDDGARYKVVGVNDGGSSFPNTDLTAIVAPNTVMSIGMYAFDSCQSLYSVSLPAATTIWSGAFYHCRSLYSVSLPAATTIVSAAFSYCYSLTTVSLPATTTIGEGAFYSCTVLTSVDFGDTPRLSVPTLGEVAFSGVPTSCKIIVPDAQYDQWVAAPGWRDLVTAGYKFLKHSEWEYARKYEVEAIDTSLLVSMAWAELKALRDNGGLKPGQQYRITNYVATTNGDMDSRSANHPFDIIVTADDERHLNEHARAIRHEGSLPDDTIENAGTDNETRTPYFPSAVKFEAWDIWYCLDNDTTRFAWAVSEDATDAQTGTPGRGVIYRMIDEFRNDVPYDFKGIQFLAYGDEDGVYRYTFDGGEESEAVDLSLNSGSAGEVSAVYENTIKPYYETERGRTLNKIVFKGNCNANTFGPDCFSNTFGAGCTSNTFGAGCIFNTFGEGCYSNTFGADFYSNTFGAYCDSNKFGAGCYANTFDRDCSSNKFGAECSSNKFGADCSSNTFGAYSYSNTFGEGCSSHTFGADCHSNTFGAYCDANTFGIGCHSNTFGGGCYSNTFGGSCHSNTFGAGCVAIKFGTASSVKAYCRYIRVGSGNQRLYINPTGTTTGTQYYQNVEIKEGVNNTATYKTITDPNVGQTFLTIYKPANSLEISL